MVKFKDLSIPLKISAIGGWIIIAVYGLATLIGFLDYILFY
jgi:hypothetical protein